MELVRQFLSSELAQDLTEYSLLIAFVVCVGGALVLMNSSAVAGIWTNASGSLSSAQSMAS